MNRGMYVVIFTTKGYFFRFKLQCFPSFGLSHFHNLLEPSKNSTCIILTEENLMASEDSLNLTEDSLTGLLVRF